MDKNLKSIFAFFPGFVFGLITYSFYYWVNIQRQVCQIARGNTQSYLTAAAGSMIPEEEACIGLFGTFSDLVFNSTEPMIWFISAVFGIAISLGYYRK